MKVWSLLNKYQYMGILDLTILVQFTVKKRFIVESRKLPEFQRFILYVYTATHIFDISPVTRNESLFCDASRRDLFWRDLYKG